MAQAKRSMPVVVPTAAGLATVVAWLVGWSLALVGLTGWSVAALPPAGLAFALLVVVAGHAGGWWRAGADLGPANLVTLLRAALVCLIAAPLAVGGGLPGWSLGLLIALALGLDAVDGWLARRLGVVSAFGARFDLEVDALLLMVLSGLCWQGGRVGPWVLAIGLMRYAFVLAGRVWPWLCRPLPESRRRKAICVIQGIVLGLALLPPVESVLASTAAALALLTLSASFVLDLAWLGQMRSTNDARTARSTATAPCSDRRRA